GVITDYPTSLPLSLLLSTIALGPDGNLWFTQNKAQSAVGVAALSTSELVATQPPPANLPAGSSFGLTVQAEDSSGNVITSFNGPVTVALGNDRSSFGTVTLGGTLTVTASSGVATFSGLTISDTTVGAYYSLYTYGGGYGWGITGKITITAAAPAQT